MERLRNSGIKWKKNIYISDAILNLEDMGHDEEEESDECEILRVKINMFE